MSEISHCPGCDQPRYQHGQGAHVGTSRAECVAADPGETVIRFWKGNKATASFDWPAGAVADAFVNDYHQRANAGDPTVHGWPVGRQLRSFLTDPARFNAVWEDEEEESIAEVVQLAKEKIRVSEHAP